MLQSKYSCTLDQERFPAQGPVIIQQWFDLYQSIKAEIRYTGRRHIQDGRK